MAFPISLQQLGKQPPQAATPAQPTQPAADPDTDPANPDYEGPENGPFECDNCTYFQAPNQCSKDEVVQAIGGQVDPKGCCKFFESMAGGSAMTGGNGDPSQGQHPYGK